MRFPLNKAIKWSGFLAASVLFASCGSMETIKTSTTEGMGKVGSGVSKGFGKMADITMSPFRPGVPVVEAREQDLKELPMGEEQAIAYQRSNGFWSFLGPISFTEPSLPGDTGSVDGGLLPPLE